MIKQVKSLIKNPDPNFIEFYDIQTTNNGKDLYISMEKLSQKELDEGAKQLTQEEDNQWQFDGNILYDMYEDPKKFFSQNRAGSLFRAMKEVYKQYGAIIADTIPENVAYKNGRLKFFDSWL